MREIDYGTSAEKTSLVRRTVQRLDDAMNLRTDYVFYPQRKVQSLDGDGNETEVIEYGDMMGKTESDSVRMQQFLKQWAVESYYLLLTRLNEKDLANFLVGVKHEPKEGEVY